jgi:tripartite-type tricarboxylate transporter receptor subunit TctC
MRNSNLSHRLHSSHRALSEFLRTLAFGAALLSTTAFAQDYPNRPIKIIVPFTPGTSMDLIARIVGANLHKRLGQPVVVENRPGATGIIGSEVVAKAAPDGYTLLATSNNIVVAPHLYKSVPFNALTAFAPITVTSYSAMTLVASIKSGIASVADMVKFAKANPGSLNYSSPGIGTTQHISMESLKDEMGLKLVHVPYKGSAGALNDLLSGEINVAFVPIDLAISHIESGKLKVLAVGSPLRQPMLPDVPTLRESGVPGVESNPWHAFAAPKGTARPIINKLNAEIHAILATPDVKSKLEQFGLRIAVGSPEDMQAMMQRESVKSAEVIRRNHISVD